MAMRGVKPGHLAALAAAHRSRAATHQPGAIPHESPKSPPAGVDPKDGMDINSLLAALKTGQLPAGGLLQMLAMLMGQGGAPQGAAPAPPGAGGDAMPPGAAQGMAGGPGSSSPIASAFMGQ